jgi:hypothetical protein
VLLIPPVAIDAAAKEVEQHACARTSTRHPQHAQVESVVVGVARWTGANPRGS